MSEANPTTAHPQDGAPRNAAEAMQDMAHAFGNVSFGAPAATITLRQAVYNADISAAERRGYERASTELTHLRREVDRLGDENCAAGLEVAEAIQRCNALEDQVRGLEIAVRTLARLLGGD
jgi:hypothetical protein